MSSEKYRNDAERWFSQAEADLNAAKSSRGAEIYEWSCFQCQQAGEKALKALWFHFQYDPWGHSVTRLIEDYPDKKTYQTSLESLIIRANALDKLYIPTRYPNGLPELSPFQVYSEKDSEEAINAAEDIISTVKKYLK